MNEFFLDICWCAIQAALLTSVVTLMVLVARVWFAGIVSDLISVSMVLLVVVVACSFVPLPSWVSVASDPPLPSKSPSIASSSKHEIAGTETEARVAPANAPIEVASNESTGQWARTLSQWWSQFGPPKSSESEGLATLPAGSLESSPTRGSIVSWPLIVGSFICACSVFGFVRVLMALFAIGGLRRRATNVDESELTLTTLQLARKLGVPNPSNIQILESAEITTAATIGWLRPAILLPLDWRTWDASERSTAIAHELAHISSGDFARNLIAQFAIVMNYFNPLIHWLGRELRVAQELGADAKAAETRGRTDYLITMAEMALRQDTTQLGWLAQPFLPTRRTFFRRIEMLKKKTGFPGANNRAAIWLARFVVLGVAVLTLGFRVPALEPAAATEPVSKTKIVAPGEGLQTAETKLAYVSDRATAVVMVDVDALRTFKWGKSIEEFVSDNRSGLFFNAKDARFVAIQFDGNHSGMVVQNKIPFADRAKELTEDATPFRYRGEDCYDMGQGRCCCFPDESTMVFADSSDLLKSMIDSGETGPVRSLWPKSLQSKMDRPIQFAISQLGIEALSQQREMIPPTFRSLLSPLWTDTEFGVGSIEFDKSRISLDVQVQSVEGKVDRVKSTMAAALTLGQNFFNGLIEDLTEEKRPENEAVLLLAKLGKSVFKAANVTSDGDSVNVTAEVKISEDELTEMVERGLKSAFTAANKTSRKNQLRMLALSMLNHESAFKNFPQAQVQGRDSEFKHSWRIAILPFIDQQALYDQYRMNEPWNSAHNSKVTAKMPEVFRHPDEPVGTTQTHFQVVVGKGTLFEPGKEIGFPQITDGSSNTMLIVEAEKTVHWASPDDLTFVPGGMKKAIGSLNGSSFLAAVSDGSVVEVKSDLNSDRVIDNFIQRADGNFSQLNESSR